jgi:hypothetical protein
MAVLIPLRGGRDKVTAKISVEGNLFWHFLYAADGGELAKSGTAAGTHDFDLGLPEKLHLDVNTWHFVLMNPHRSPTSFTIGIQWEQAGVTIATWPPKGPKKGTVKAGENTVINDSGFLAVGDESEENQ